VYPRVCDWPFTVPNLFNDIIMHIIPLKDTIVHADGIAVIIPISKNDDLLKSVDIK